MFVIVPRFCQLLDKAAAQVATIKTLRFAATGAAAYNAPEPMIAPRNLVKPVTPKLVIFDKDGTLICFHTMWMPWAIRTAKKIQHETGLSLEAQVYEILGLCSVENKIKPGLLAEGTMEQIRGSLMEMLLTRNVELAVATSLVDGTVTDSFHRCGGESLREIDNLQALFMRLRRNYVKIAICTADNRNSTLAMMRHTGVEAMVDEVVCGDDAGSLPKPHPRNALEICRRLRIHPGEAVMVGDTRADLVMAQEAGLSAGIGVLSGVGDKEHLAPHASMLVNHVGELAEVFNC